MRNPVRIVALAALLLCMSVSVAFAGDTATQTVTFSISAINEISVSGNPAALTVSAATAGSEPNSVSNALTTYSITTNESNRKITAALDSDMPANVTLTVNLAAPTGATSAGATSLSAVAADVVTGIGTVAEGALSITYALTATVDAGTAGADTRTVTFTVAAGA